MGGDAPAARFNPTLKRVAKAELKKDTGQPKKPQ